jgi:type I restriction enzyme R subunit
LPLVRRPDIVLYLNGIAIGVIELKRASAEVANGIRQLITSNRPTPFGAPQFNRNRYASSTFRKAGPA